jgi:uncharacterized protein (TIGR02145 family)
VERNNPYDEQAFNYIGNASVEGSSSSVETDNYPSSSSVVSSGSSVVLSSSSVNSSSSSEESLTSSSSVVPSSSSAQQSSSSSATSSSSSAQQSSSSVAPSSSSATPSSSSIWQSSSSVAPSSSSAARSSQSSGSLCAGFTNGTKRLHYGKEKEQFCDMRDDKKYVYVKIGEQTWMAENLNYEVNVCYNNDCTCYINDCETYGRRYRWETAMNGAASSTTNPSGVRGICPSGWHLPSKEEWDELKAYSDNDLVNIGSDGKKLKATSGWYRDGNGTDDYGFSALPGSYGDSDGRWWSTSETSDYGANNWVMRDNNDYAFWVSDGKFNTFSVRCLKD